MDKLPSWEARLQEELARAEAARLAGKEGMARVCARRAAGITAGEYLRRLGLRNLNPSAYDRLRLLAEHPHTPVQVKAVARHFLVRITPEHNLPIQADLITDARWLAFELLQYK